MTLRHLMSFSLLLWVIALSQSGFHTYACELASLENADLPQLSAEDTPTLIKETLSDALIGQTRAEIIPLLTKIGARGASIYDFMDTELALGTDLGGGYRAGTPVMTVIFGLARGRLQPDRRLRLYLEYGNDNQILKLIEVEYYAK